VRAILPVGLWAVLTPSAIGVARAQRVSDPNGLARQILRFSAHNSLHWGVDDVSDVFAAYTFTLESGFPEEAIKVVLRSIPLVDESVGEIVQFIE